jgi:alkaline phosphatase D
LKSALTRSTAVWKFIGNSVPIAHARKKERPRYDKWANGDDGPPLGRELELANILSSIRHGGVRNVVWLAADVHYSAAHYFSPDGAEFRDFDPFWEFTAGPFHTRPGRVRHLDGTFGPRRQFRTPLSPEGNTPPSVGYQYFGHVRIDAASADATVSLRDLEGKVLYQTILRARR